MGLPCPGEPQLKELSTLNVSSASVGATVGESTRELLRGSWIACLGMSGNGKKKQLFKLLSGAICDLQLSEF